MQFSLTDDNRCSTRTYLFVINNQCIEFNYSYLPSLFCHMLHIKLVKNLQYSLVKENFILRNDSLFEMKNLLQIIVCKKIKGLKLLRYKFYFLRSI